MIWTQRKFEDLEPLTHPFFQDLRETYGEDWTRWVKKTAQDLVWVLLGDDIVPLPILGFIKLKYGPKGVKICSFNISRRVRKRGYGGMILSDLEDDGREKGYTRIYTTIDSSKTSMLRWIKSKGFKEIGEKETGVGEGRFIKEIVLEKIL